MAIEVSSENRDVVLELDAEKMVRVINNLLSNAIKYGHENSTILMEVLKKEGVITIAVRNEGDPISKEVLDQLFYKVLSCRRLSFKRDGWNRFRVSDCGKHCAFPWRNHVCRVGKRTNEFLCLSTH